MKEFPYVEEIYDMETSQLKSLLEQINTDLQSGGNCIIPDRFETFEKYQKKALKLKEYLELELDERGQVDNVLNFFMQSGDDFQNDKFLDDDQFYKPMNVQGSSTNSTANSIPQITQKEEDYEISSSKLQAQSEIEPSDNFSEQQSQMSSKQMFANRSKMTKKDMQNNMRAMLAKTKVANEVTTSSTPSDSKSGGYQPKRNFQAQKPPPPAKKKSVVRSSMASTTTKEIVINSQKSIYKPNLKKVDSTNQIVNKKTPSSGKVQKFEKGGTTYKPPTIPIYKKPEINPVQTPKKENVQEKESEKDKEDGEEIQSQYYDDAQEQIPIEKSESKKLNEDLDSVADTQKEEEKVQEEKVIPDKIDIPKIIDEVKINTEPKKPSKLKKLVDSSDDSDDLGHYFQEDKKEEPEHQAEDISVAEPDTSVIEPLVDPPQKEESDGDGDEGEGEDDETIVEGETTIIEDQSFYPLNDLLPESKEESNVYENSPPPVKKRQQESSVERQKEALDTEMSKLESLQQQNKISEKILEEKLQEKPIDQHEIKIREIEEKIKRRKEEQEAKKIKSKQVQDLFVMTEEQQKIREKQQQIDVEKIREEMQKEKTPVKPKIEEIEVAPIQASAPVSTTAKKAAPKRRIAKPKEEEGIKDYTDIFSSFYDIFVGNQIDPKAFDLPYVVRETRTMYASFVNLMDSNAVAMKQKFKFDKAPLEMGIRDYGIFPNYLLNNMKQDLDEIQSQAMEAVEPKTRKQMMIEVALAKHQDLQEKFQAQKGKSQDEIISAAQKLAQPEEKVAKFVDQNRDPTLYFRVVKTKTEVYDIITRAFSRKNGWSELPHGLDLRNSWNFMWSWSKITIDLSKLLVFQKVNHFTGNKNVSRKDFLKRNIERAQKMSGKANSVFNIMPMTFILPKEYVGFLENFTEFEEQEGKFNYWIMKPAAQSRGRGIQVINDISSVIYGEPMVMQRYLKNPLLLNGYKFDLRIYILVTSVNPLEMFIYKEGFGRFSTVPYNLDPNDKANRYIHLTNYSINKYNKNIDPINNDEISGGCKVSLETLKKKIEAAYNISWDKQIWEQIKDVCLKAMVAAQNDIQYNPSCFEVYGFDVIIDSDFKIWLLEINSSPSLARDTMLDDIIKQKMIDDSISLIDPIDFDRKRLFEVLERRIHEDFSKSSGSTNTHTKRQMNRDLTYILNGKVPRKYGEMPEKLGNYTRIAPSEASERYLKLIGGQKMFGSLMKVSHKPEILGDRIAKNNQIGRKAAKQIENLNI